MEKRETLKKDDEEREREASHRQTHIPIPLSHDDVVYNDDDNAHAIVSGCFSQIPSSKPILPLLRCRECVQLLLWVFRNSTREFKDCIKWHTKKERGRNLWRRDTHIRQKSISLGRIQSWKMVVVVVAAFPKSQTYSPILTLSCSETGFSMLLHSSSMQQSPRRKTSSPNTEILNAAAIAKN